MRRFNQIKGESGLNLIELTVVIAITGLITIPLVSIFGVQLRIPAKVATEIAAARQIQKSTLLLTEDAQSATSFVTGSNPVYGVFTWTELAGPEPVPVTSRYQFEPGEELDTVIVDGEPVVLRAPGRVVRVLKRGIEVTAPFIILEGLISYEEVLFQVEDPIWDFNSVTGTWTYTEGKIIVSIFQIHEAGAEFGIESLEEAFIADFRPQGARPVPPPPPG